MITRIVWLLLLGLSLGFAQDNARTVADLVADGNMNLTRGDCQFAQYFFQEALKAEPENTEATLGKGRALVCQGAYDLGITELLRVSETEPNNVAARVQLAEAYKEQYDSDRARFAAKLDDALAVIQNAERIEPDNAELLNIKGVVLFLQGTRSGDMEALEGARKALEGTVASYDSMSIQDQALVQINLGKTYLELGERELALGAFKRAVSLNPASASAHNNVGATYIALGNCDDGIYELTQAVNLNPGSVSATFNLGRAKFDCDQVEASLPHFEAALELPDSLSIPQLYTYASRAYVLLGRFDEAVRRAQQGALLPPTSAEALYYLGQGYEARNAEGDSQRARDAYESALEIDPDYSLAQEALANL